METLRYPTGRFQANREPTAAELEEFRNAIAALPAELAAATAGLDDRQLDTPYRPEGWTLRQVVHHVADSHVNAYVRTRLALTEDRPTIRTYVEAEWARLPDAEKAPIEVSLRLLEALHQRWAALLRALPDTALDRPLEHPDHGTLPLKVLLGLYTWHGRHHVAHIVRLRERMGW
ncbi:MAG: putative metal-dependent hydrolase [Thermoanaerobaculia bacterium]